MTLFNEERARSYDAGARTFLPGYEALHETVRDALTAELSPDASARVLLLGVGTGFEALHLHQRCPNWKLVGVDPSAPMLAVARQRLDQQVELRQGVIDDFADLQQLDAIVSVGVLHHLPTRAEQPAWIATLGSRLRPGGTLLLATHIGLLRADAPQFRVMQSRWRHAGASDADIAQRTEAMTNLILPPGPEELRAWYGQAGLTPPAILFSTGYFHLLAATRSPAG